VALAVVSIRLDELEEDDLEAYSLSNIGRF
jgi:hypothetical protein